MNDLNVVAVSSSVLPSSYDDDDNNHVIHNATSASYDGDIIIIGGGSSSSNSPDTSHMNSRDSTSVSSITNINNTHESLFTASSVIAHANIPSNPNATTAQNAMNRLKEANAKYKQLLKLAKERIQSQDDELELLRAVAVTHGASASGGTTQTLSNTTTHSATNNSLVDSSMMTLSLGTAFCVPIGAIQTPHYQSQQLIHTFLDLFTLDYDTLPPTTIMNREVDSYSSTSSTTGDSLGNSYSMTCSVVKVIQRIQIQDSLSHHNHNNISQTTSSSWDDDFTMSITSSNSKSTSWEESTTIKASSSLLSSSSYPSLSDTIWALIEYEMNLPDTSSNDILMVFHHITSFFSSFKLQQPLFLQNHQNQNQNSTSSSSSSSFKFQRWKRFTSNNQLLDHIRKDRGEPITVPPFSLSPQQTLQLTLDTKQQVEKITEEYRKFRVKHEIIKKQMEDTIRMLQQNQVQRLTQSTPMVPTIVGGENTTATVTMTHLDSALHNNTSSSYVYEKLQKDMIQQEIQWKKMYDDLLHENIKLKSTASEGYVASQWRHRYELICKERDDWKTKCEVLVMREQQQEHHQGGEEEEVQEEGETIFGKDIRTKQGDPHTSNIKNYESKYRDLKESFRLYRKKAKEIFDAQQRGDVSTLANGSNPTSMSNRNLSSSSSSSEDAKILYLKNLMVNYLCADESSDVRGPMERAIGTVLQFNDADYTRIHTKKSSSSIITSSTHGGSTSSWFG